MGELVWKNTKLYYGGYDLTGDANNVSVAYSADMVDVTVFGSSARKRMAGLKNVEITAAGFLNAATGKNDPVLFPEISADAEVVSIIPAGTALGNDAFFAKQVAGELSQGGAIGEAATFNFAGSGEGTQLIRGKLMEAGSKSTGNTPTVRNLGARSSTKKMYAGLHVISVSSSGTKMDISVQTSASSAFGALTTEAKFTQILDSAAGTAQWKSTGSSTSKQWARVQWQSTSTGVNGSVNFVGVIGIQ